MSDEVAGGGPDDDVLVIESLALQHLKEAVEQLPSRERQVLLLHVNSGLTYWEIAGRLGVAEQAVLGDLSHAYSQLRVQLRLDDLQR
jgi:DNA-directed RNA polymerase specialized sigma24 family protein